MYPFRNILKAIFYKLEKKKFNDVAIYKGLDTLPLYNWRKLYSEKSLKYLIIKEECRTFEDNPILNKILEDTWLSIYDEYLEDFGLNKKMKRVLEIERKIALLTCDLWIDDNKFLKNQIRILNKQLEKENQTKIDAKGNDFERQLVLIEKWLQSSINIKQISTRKYFTYLQLIKEEAEEYKMNKALKNNG